MADEFERQAISFDILRTDLGTLRAWTQDAITKLSREMDQRLAETRTPIGSLSSRLVEVEQIAHRLDADVLRLKRERSESILRENAADRRLVRWTVRWGVWVAVVTVATDVVVIVAAYGMWRLMR